MECIWRRLVNDMVHSSLIELIAEVKEEQSKIKKLLKQLGVKDGTKEKSRKR